MTYNHQFFAALNCPTQVTWTNNIKSMFTATDIAHMKQAANLDLSDYNSVKVWAHKIYQEVASGAMPPPGTAGEGAWSAAQVNTFGCWIQQGCPQ